MSLFSSIAGSLGKGISGAVSGIGGFAGKALPLAAAFLPGPWGAVASGVGGLLAGAADNKKANAATGTASGIYNKQAGVYNQYYGPLMDAVAQQNGYDPKTKTFSPTNPYGAANPNAYGAVNPNIYGTPSANAYGAASPTPYGDASQNPYTGVFGSAQYNGAAEKLGRSNDIAAQSAMNDGLGMGFSGGNSAVASQVGNIRRNLGTDLMGVNRDLLVAGSQEQYNRNRANVDESYRQNAANVNERQRITEANANNAQQQGNMNSQEYIRENERNANAGYERLAGMLPMLSGMGNTSANNLMGLGNMYASQAGNMGQQVGQLTGALGQTGAFNGISDWLKSKFGKRGSPQSNSAGTSTANAAPMPTPWDLSLPPSDTGAYGQFSLPPVNPGGYQQYGLGL